MHTARTYFTGTLLPNGEVLVAGGDSTPTLQPGLSSAELYNPATGEWSSTGSLNHGRNRHTATLLQSGQVLIAAGYGASEQYNPSNGTFTVTASEPFVVDTVAVLLKDGAVLLPGGFSNGQEGLAWLNTALLYH